MKKYKEIISSYISKDNVKHIYGAKPDFKTIYYKKFFFLNYVIELEINKLCLCPFIYHQRPDKPEIDFSSKDTLNYIKSRSFITLQLGKYVIILSKFKYTNCNLRKVNKIINSIELE